MMTEQVSVAVLRKLLDNFPKWDRKEWSEFAFRVVTQKRLKEFEEKFGLMQKQLQEMIKELDDPDKMDFEEWLPRFKKKVLGVP